jgi:hypothetical protein
MLIETRVLGKRPRALDNWSIPFPPDSGQLGDGGLTLRELESHHAIVRGTLGTYSIHLGSAGVVLMPGTALPIAAVHSQHRGRIFLPFADDDPRTAEVLSKVLLLARDKEIRDPNILEWIRATKRGGVSLSGAQASVAEDV